MAKYRCPEGDHEQEMPGKCPNHPDMDLVMVEEEGEKEKMEGMEEGEKEEMDDEEDMEE